MLDNIQNCFSYFKRKIEPQDLHEMQVGLLEESTLDINYIVLILGSCAIATLGLLSNSAAVIIGAVIIAPLMLPIRGLAFGALAGNVALFRLGLIAIVVGTVLAIFLAWLLGSLVSLPEFSSDSYSPLRTNLARSGNCRCCWGN